MTDYDIILTYFNTNEGANMYNVGDKFTSKYFTDFEIINIFEHYKGTVIVTYNAKGEYSARGLKKFEEHIEKGRYKMDIGQISMGTTI